MMENFVIDTIIIIITLIQGCKPFQATPTKQVFVSLKGSFQNSLKYPCPFCTGVLPGSRNW